VIALRRFDAARQEEDYWGNNLALLGDDGMLYCYMHWERLAEGVEIGSRVGAGQVVGTVGRSGFESKPFATHLHLEMMILHHPERFTFAYALEPEVLPTPNRFLQADVEGYAICPYPYLVEWYGERGR
jgi:murein DD-endopeptidase MepM/ murein hydrolase activator NlpD